MTTLSLSFQQLQAQMGTTTFARGQDVLKRKKVLSVRVQAQDDGTAQINASTQGSLDETYQQDIVVDDTGKKLSVRGFCTCPVDYNCKHVVAAVLRVSHDLDRAQLIAQAAAHSPQGAALQMLGQVQTAQELALKQAQHSAASWLKQLSHIDSQALPHPDTRASATQDTVVYALKYGLKQLSKHVYSTRVLGNLTVNAYLSHPRANGKGWLKPKPMSYSNEHVFDQAGSQHAETVKLLKLLSPYRTLSHPGALEGKLGAMAFDIAMSQPHVFLTTSGRDELSVPLQRGQAVRLDWHWQCTDAAALDPVWQLDWAAIDAQGHPADVLLYPGPPSLYVDVIRGLAGTVELGTLSAARLNQLLAAPALPASVIRSQEMDIRQLLGDIALPPVLGQVRTLSGIKPSAQLLIQRIAPQERYLKGWCSATPQFKYGEHVITWNTQGANVMLPTDGSDERLMLVRDTDTETQLLNSLDMTGMYHHGQTEWLFAPPASQLLWLQWAGEDYAALKALGFEIVIAPSMHGFLQHIEDIHIEMGEPAQPDSPDTIAPQNQWFDLSLGVDIGGVRQDILPWLPSILDTLSRTPTMDSGEPQYPEWVYLPRNAQGDDYIRLNIVPLHPWLTALIDLVGEREKDFNQGGVLRLSRLEALRATAALGEGAVWSGAAPLRNMLAQLKGQTSLPQVPLPTGLNAQLRPYQHQGLNWLQFLRSHGLSGVLADDMGLGKTLQTLAHILLEKQSGRMSTPVLVVAPVSLMGNWAQEAQRFTPELRVQVFHGLDRHTGADTLIDNDIVLTSYALLAREKDRWLATDWHMVVLDEAQNIKNANTHAAKVVSQINAKQRLCLSGTPMENHLGELWSLFHFLMPGFLGGNAKFTKLFRTPIEKHGNTERLVQLRNRVTPFMLRRNKSAVAAELPPKVETITRVKLEGKQADLYETIRLATEVKVREALASKGLARSQITVLDALLKLRQVCCDPRLVPLDKAKTIQESAKLEQLMDMLPEMLAEGRRVLLFSQFTSMLELIEVELKARNLPWVKLTGQSTKRDALIERFTSGQVPLFLISLKAGGVGLNLPQADTVIHYDPWWNPAVENQATDRAHRIGQQSTVFVYKMVAEGTIEERILALQARKAELAGSMYDGAEGRKAPMFTESDVMDLLQPLG
jgi:superfamily II DNA or RNA helicase